MKFWFLILIAFIGCQSKPKHSTSLKGPDQQVSLMEWNKEVLKNEVQSIESFLTHNKYKIQKTETGLYWFNLVIGSGNIATNGDKVWVRYSVELMDGTFCFQTDSLMPDVFILGRNRKPAGLNEGVSMMQEDEKRSFIIPHYLLYGIAGDRKMIPPITPAIFHVHLLKVEKR